MQQNEPELMQFAEGVQIEDAYVNFQLNASNKPGIYLIVDNTTIRRDEWFPLEGAEDEIWLAENDYGVFRGWQESLPVSEETGSGWTPGTVEHADLGEVERYEAFDHVVSRKQNEREVDSVLSVRVAGGFKGSPTSYAIRVEQVQEIVERYINGPLGSDDVSYWYAYHTSGGRSPWGTSMNLDKYEGYLDCDVELVHDSIYTWYPKRVQDITPDDRVYDEGGL